MISDLTDFFSELISFSCSTSVDKNTASTGSRIGVTVFDDACDLALCYPNELLRVFDILEMHKNQHIFSKYVD
jgi:hypothetical protein